MNCGTCDAAVAIGAVECTACGLSFASTSVFRRGKLLVVPRDTTLPSWCVLCDKRAADATKKTEFSWHNPWIYVLLLSPLIYVVVALIVRKTMKFQVPLCSEHRRRRSRLSWAGGLCFLAAVPVAVALGYALGEEWMAVPILTGLGMALGGLIVVARGSATIAATHIDQHRGLFRGASEAFLKRLIDLPEGLLGF